MPDGSTVNIERFVFGFSSPLDTMRGSWAFSNLSIIGADADWITLRPSTTSTTTVSGLVLGSSTRAGACTPLNNGAGILCLINSSTSFDDIYQINFEKNTPRGLNWLVRTGQAPSGSGSPAIAARVFYAIEAPATASPSVQAKIARDRAESDEFRFQQQESMRLSSDSEDMESIREAVEFLRAL